MFGVNCNPPEDELTVAVPVPVPVMVPPTVRLFVVVNELPTYIFPFVSTTSTLLPSIFNRSAIVPVAPVPWVSVFVNKAPAAFVPTVVIVTLVVVGEIVITVPLFVTLNGPVKDTFACWLLKPVNGPPILIVAGPPDAKAVRQVRKRESRCFIISK